MKKIDLGQAIQTLANLGVIAGIVFLAVEISQNNDELASQSRNTLYQMRADLQEAYIYNRGGIADLDGKAARGEPLTQIEQGRLGSRRSHILQTLEYMFQEDREGTMKSAGWVAIVFGNDPDLSEVWDRSRGIRDPEFVEWFEESVMPQIEL